MSNTMLGRWTVGMPGKDRRLRRRLNSRPPMSRNLKAFWSFALIVLVAAVCIKLGMFISDLIPPRPM